MGSRFLQTSCYHHLLMLHALSLYRLTCIAVCLDLVKRCVDHYATSPAFQEIFSPIEKIIREHLPQNTYPEQIQVNVCSVPAGDLVLELGCIQGGGLQEIKDGFMCRCYNLWSRTSRQWRNLRFIVSDFREVPAFLYPLFIPHTVSCSKIIRFCLVLKGLNT